MPIDIDRQAIVRAYYHDAWQTVGTGLKTAVATAVVFLVAMREAVPSVDLTTALVAVSAAAAVVAGIIAYQVRSRRVQIARDVDATATANFAAIAQMAPNAIAEAETLDTAELVADALAEKKAR